MTKTRTSLSIDRQIWERVKAVAEKLPGASFSSVVEACVEMSIPKWEAMAAAAQIDGTPKEKERAMIEALGQSFLDELRNIHGVEEDPDT